MSHETEKTLLRTLVELIAERNAFGPGENFEFMLWRDMSEGRHTFGSAEEYDEIQWLAEVTQCWVTVDLETNKFTLIDLPSWHTLLERE